MPIDYSKWKNIEISDDEEDTHPNIDTPSLFKWRHEARVQRMDEFEKKKQEAKAEKERKDRELAEIKRKAQHHLLDDPDALKRIKDLEKDQSKAAEKLEAINKEERLQAWNVDTISKDGFSKSTINKPMPRQKEELSEEEKENKMKKFVQDNKSDLKAFGWLSKMDDSKAFMLERPHLACEETANYLVIQCLNLEMEEKHAAMEQVAHQCICIQYLLELARQLDVDPRSCISSFFTKIQLADPEYKQAFEDELVAFKDRIRTRAKQKIQEALEEEEAERQRELDEGKADRIKESPGGLDPIEVLESLPEDLRRCFEEQDTAMLQEVIRNLGEKDARYHMKRCVDSGLWKPAQDDPETNPEDGFRKAQSEEQDADDEKEEDHYEDPSKLNQK